jgi:peptide/nickel transport system permease protein
LRGRDFVAAGRALGLGEGRIVVRHVLPNTTHLIIVTFTLGAIQYVQAEVILTFLGIGITEKPSWGRMIDDARLELLRGVWWQVAAATTAIFILCLALSYVGDALRDALDPKLRGVS